MAEIGEEAERSAASVDDKSHRLHRIMRHEEGADGGSLEIEGRAALEDLPAAEVGHLVAEDGGGLPVAVDRRCVLLRPLGKPARMIAVLVGNKDRAEIARLHPARAEAKGQLLGAESRINEEGGCLGPYQGGIAAASAGKDRDFKHRERMSPVNPSR